MDQQPAPRAFRSADPWQATSCLLAGVLVYGVLGWLADRWLGTSFLVAVGIVLGAVMGIYLTWRRLAALEQHDTTKH